MTCVFNWSLIVKHDEQQKIQISNIKHEKDKKMKSIFLKCAFCIIISSLDQVPQLNLLGSLGLGLYGFA